MRKLFRGLFPNKEMRAYHKMHRRHRKELIKHAKKTKEWDWIWLHDSVIMQIRHMHEYYTAGNNVWQTRRSLISLINSLKYVLDLNNKIDHLWDDQTRERFVDEEAALYKKIYMYISDNLLSWWD